MNLWAIQGMWPSWGGNDIPAIPGSAAKLKRSKKGKAIASGVKRECSLQPQGTLYLLVGLAGTVKGRILEPPTGVDFL